MNEVVSGPIGAFATLAAVILAGLMGFAIQRGGTCMVAAVEQVVTKRRYLRIRALAEAVLWAMALIALAMLAGQELAVPTVYTFGIPVFAGGVLLGLGAFVNGACLFGTVARLGSGNVNYLLTPAGYYLGVVLFTQAELTNPTNLRNASATIGGWILWATILVFLGYSIWRIYRSWPERFHASQFWNEHYATVLVGVSSVLLILIAGSWSYSEALAGLARQELSLVPLSGVLFAALFAGSIASGWKSVVYTGPSLRAGLGRFAGGSLMGIGGALVPGGNDFLVLVGLPTFDGYAFTAIATMIATIWACLLAKTVLFSRVVKVVASRSIHGPESR